jgi:hypothetical protein
MLLSLDKLRPMRRSCISAIRYANRTDYSLGTNLCQEGEDFDSSVFFFADIVKYGVFFLWAWIGAISMMCITAYQNYLLS